MIILGIILDLGGGPDHDRIGFRYWKHPGPFVQFDGIAGSKGRFLGWWAVLTQAAFSFIGTEIVAVSCGRRAYSSNEQSPSRLRLARRKIRDATSRKQFAACTSASCCSISVALPSSACLYPRTTQASLWEAAPPPPPLLSSPSSVLASRLSRRCAFPKALIGFGLKRVPCPRLSTRVFSPLLGLPLRVICTQVRVRCVSVIFEAQSLPAKTFLDADGLALAGNAPKIFKMTLRNGLPVTALVLSSSFSLLAYMGVHTGSGKVFNWFANMTSVAGLLTWFGISFTYTRFYAGMKAQGIDRKSLPFYSPLQPFAAWYAAISCLVVCLVRSQYIPSLLTLTSMQFSGWSVFLRGNWNTADFVTSYLPLVLFPILYITAKLRTRVPVVKASEMDFYTGLAEIEASTYDEPPPKNKLQAFWQWLVSDGSTLSFASAYRPPSE